MKDGIINEKDAEIDRLRKELYTVQYGKTEQAKTFEIKKLLEIIDRMTEENTVLRGRLEGEGKFYKETFEKEKKDIYNEIHNKIDILNISIDKKNQDEQDFLKDSKKAKFAKPKFYK
jgi:hypothetical protein